MKTPRQYSAIRRAAGILERSARACIAVGGTDRADYLQGLLSNDVAGLAPGAGCYATWLTPQGRLIADMDVFNLGDRILLDVDAGVKPLLMARFDELIFAEDAVLADWSGTRAGYGVHGPEALRVAAAALDRLRLGGGALADVRRLGPHGCRQAAAHGETTVVARTDELGAPGVAIVVERGRAAALHAALLAAGGIDVDQPAAEAVRIESGRPRFPVDMDGDTIPLEAGIEERAISFTKGCYVGQEVIVRVLHRGAGRVARRLVGLTIDSPGPDGGAPVPAPGAGLWRADERVGRVTSAAASPALGRAIALGYLPRDLTGAGTRVQVDLPGGRGAGVVTATPFAATPAVAG